MVVMPMPLEKTCTQSQRILRAMRLAGWWELVSCLTWCR